MGSRLTEIVVDSRDPAVQAAFWSAALATTWCGSGRGGACRFLFIDQSKNGSRRWCSMDDCGKAAKIARYLQRRSGTQRREETG